VKLEGVVEAATMSLDGLQEQFEEVCGGLAASFVPGAWGVDECSRDLLQQLRQWTAVACAPRNYTTPHSASEGSCGVALRGEVRPPTAVKVSEGGTPYLTPQCRRLLDDVILPQRRRAGMNGYYLDVARFFASLRGGSNGAAELRLVEVGTLYGGLADTLLGELRNATVWAVDPLLPNYDGGAEGTDARTATVGGASSKASHATAAEEVRAREDDVADGSAAMYARVARDLKLTPHEFSHCWATALAQDQRSTHGCRHKLLKLFSTDAARLFADNSLDGVFIDGLHTYAAVSADINAWLPKLKRPGGALVFNDYLDVSTIGGGLGNHSPDLSQVAFPGVVRAVDDFVRGHRLKLIVGDYGKPPGIINAAVVF